MDWDIQLTARRDFDGEPIAKDAIYVDSIGLINVGKEYQFRFIPIAYVNNPDRRKIQDEDIQILSGYFLPKVYKVFKSWSKDGEISLPEIIKSHAVPMRAMDVRRRHENLDFVTESMQQYNDALVQARKRRKFKRKARLVNG
jgi:hypothetical protein